MDMSVRPSPVSEIAAAMNGVEYRDVHKRAAELRKHAMGAGVVIVYGQSDDLMEFDGAVHDELGAYNGTEAFVDRKGLLPERESIDTDAEISDYYQRKTGGASKITANWCPDGSGGVRWTYTTSIPHATFEVVDDGEVYCRGIVFALADAGGVV